MPDVASLSDLPDEPRAVVFEEPPTRVVRLALDAGEEIPPHRHEGRGVIVHVLSGELAVTLDGDAVDLAGGGLLRFDGASEVALRAVDNAAALVILLPAGGTAD